MTSPRRFTSPAGISKAVVVFTIYCFCHAVEGFSVGAPFSTCLTMFPKHGTNRQAGPSPYLMTLSPDTYRPGQVITVQMLSADGRRFKGLQVKATRSQGDTENVLGSFVSNPENITKVFSCEGGFKNMVTHTPGMAGKDKPGVDSVTLEWRAPDTNVGDVVFVATFVETFDVFWTGVTMKLAPEQKPIVSLTESEQDEALRSKEQECLKRIQDNPSTDNSHCPVLWDQIACWPETKAGEMSTRPCPDYINGVRTYPNATRLCHPNGEWMSKSNYSRCLEKSDELLPQLRPVPYQAMTLDGCGDSKGCFLYPRYCSGDDCTAAVTFRRHDQDLLFEMMAKEATYVSVGFSHDVHMGDDETISCTAEDQLLTVQHGFNPKLYNQRIVRTQLSGLAVNTSEGNLICGFRRPIRAVTRFINQSAPDLQFVSTLYDLNDDYYVMLAWGKVKKGTDVMAKHKELPPVTDTKVSFRRHDIYRGSALPLESRIHGSLMVVSWVLLTGLTTVMSRYYKHWLPNRLYCGTPIWFQVHRVAAITSGLLTVASVILMVVHIGGYSEKEQKHAIVGFTVLSLVLAQILAGLFRPDKDSSVRPFFKWGHTVLGHSAHILSAVAMYLAFDIRYIPSVMNFLGVAVLTGWVPVQIAWTIALELRRCCTVDKEPTKERESWRKALTSADSLLLFFYCLTLVLLASATLSAILVF